MLTLNVWPSSSSAPLARGAPRVLTRPGKLGAEEGFAVDDGAFLDALDALLPAPREGLVAPKDRNGDRTLDARPYGNNVPGWRGGRGGSKETLRYVLHKSVIVACRAAPATFAKP